MTTYHLFALISITILSLVHYISSRLEQSKWFWHSRFLSFAGGVSISYVFIDLLPKLGEAQDTVRSTGLLPFFEKHVYVLALIGMLVFYAIEQYNQKTKGLYNGLSSFWLSLLSYGTFNFLLGYAVTDQDDPEVQPLVLFTIAMALHLFINDHNLFQTHKGPYQYLGRAFLVSCLVLGFMIGLSADITDSAVALIVGFLSGGIIMNVFHQELPEGYKPNSLKPFLLGSLIYGTILLFIGVN